MSKQCWYCGIEILEWPKTSTQGLDLRRFIVREHQVPKSKGGTKTVLACVSCNSQKGQKDVEGFRTYLRNKKYSTLRAANAIRETLPVLPEDFRKEIEVVAVTLEFLTPQIVFFGEKKNG